jgi:hypothetical protein
MKKVSLAGAALCAISTLVPAIALAAGIDGTGSIPTCPARGSIKLKPALVTGGSEVGAVKVVSKSSGVCSGGTGDGATIVGVKAKAAGTTAANTCTDFSGTASSDLALTFKYKVAKGSPKLNPSTATFSIAPGSLTVDGTQTFSLSGTITAGSFVGDEITAFFDSDETAATLLALCGDKGIKKVTFGDDEATSSCVNGPNMAAAITKQITSLDSNDVPHLEVEILTLTASPFQLSNPDFETSNTGIHLESVNSTCSQDPSGDYRCRHTAFYESTGACQWDGNYSVALSYACSPTNTCDLCSGDATVPFTLDSENFCDSTTVFCVPDLSCAEATAGSSSGGVPCCSDTYSPLITCLETYCPTECAAVIDGEAGIVPSSPCYDCGFFNCTTQYQACGNDNAECPLD